MVISVLDPNGVMPKKGLRETLIKTNFLLTQRANLQAIAAGVARRIGEGASKRLVQPKTGRKVKPKLASNTKTSFPNNKSRAERLPGKTNKIS